MSSYIQPVIQAFIKGKSKKISNTETNGQSLFLFGNEIARKNQFGHIYVTTAGWNTATTRSRLNMIPGVWVSCRKNNLQINFINNRDEWQDWDGQWINVEK